MGAGIEGLLRQPQHDGGVFADGVEHHRVLELGGDLAEDVDALGLEKLDVVQPIRARASVAVRDRCSLMVVARRLRWLS